MFLLNSFGLVKNLLFAERVVNEILLGIVQRTIFIGLIISLSSWSKICKKKIQRAECKKAEFLFRAD